jgi:Glyoxalase/Bleomycin resistance protein/Dioxygenase superfamily
MSAQLSGILQLAITVQDIARATKFYRDVLGLRLLMEGPNMAFFDCGGVRLYLACGDGATKPEADRYILEPPTWMRSALRSKATMRRCIKSRIFSRACRTMTYGLCGSEILKTIFSASWKSARTEHLAKVCCASSHPNGEACNSRSMTGGQTY